MNRSIATLAIAVAAALVAAPAGAVLNTESFDGIRGELEHRRDDDFGGTLDATAKKRQKAVLKSLVLIAKEADDLGDDIKIAGTVAGLLQKVYAEEFSVPGSHEGLVGDELSGLQETLEGFVGDAYDDLEGRVESLSEKGVAKVQKALDKALASLDASADEETGTKPAFLQLGKAWKSVAKGAKSADKDPGLGISTLSMTVGGDAVNGDEFAKVEIHKSGNVFQLSADGPRGAGPGHAALLLAVPGVTGPGTYALTGDGVTCFVNNQPNGFGTEPSQIFNATSGSITITTYNPKGRMVGTFSFTGNAQGIGDLDVTNGVFDVSEILRY
jgi:hypothetical protein